MARPKVHDDRLRERLLTEAAQRVGERGPDAVTVREIATAAGTSTSAVYSLFGSREELLLALLGAAADDFARDQRAVPVTTDPPSDLAALAHAYRRWGLDHPHWYRVLFGGAVPCPPEAADRVSGTMDPLLHAVARARGEDPSSATPSAGTLAQALACWSLVHGWVGLELQGMLAVTAAPGGADAAFDAVVRTSLLHLRAPVG